MSNYYVGTDGKWSKGGGPGGWFVRRGNWSFAYLPGDDYVPLSERYGTTRTWRLGPFSVRRHGTMGGTR